MSFYFDALAGLMEAVHGCALSYFFRNLIILECACHVVVAFEMHGNEVARIDSLEELLGAFGTARAETDVDGEENHVDFWCDGCDAVDYYGESLGGFVNFARSTLFFPVPVVEVACMENSESVGYRDEVAYAPVGRTECLDIDVADCDIIAGMHPVGWNVVAYVAARQFVGEHIYAFMRLSEIEDILVVMVFVNMCHEEDDRLVGMMFESLLYVMGGVDVIIENKKYIGKFYQKPRIVEVCDFYSHVQSLLLILTFRPS